MGNTENKFFSFLSTTSIIYSSPLPSFVIALLLKKRCCLIFCIHHYDKDCTGKRLKIVALGFPAGTGTS